MQFLVAGLVGEFWTRICLRHLPRYATMDVAELVRLGVNFGKGLQLGIGVRQQLVTTRPAV